ncbi:junctional sarcoplasmic reticulum protein 1 [Discoglossus pictus]
MTTALLKKLKPFCQTQRAVACPRVDLQPREGEEVKKTVEDPNTSGAESKKKCELQITEDLDEIVETSSESGDKKPRPIPKPTKRIVEAKSAPKAAVAKKKSEPKNLGPVKEEDSAPWNGVTLNRCLVVAAIAALLSMGFQVLQEVVDTDDGLTEFEAGPWIPSDPNDQLPEPWFFEGWFGSSGTVQPELPEAELPEDEEDQLYEAIEEELEEEEPVEEELVEDEPTEVESASIAETPPESEEMAEKTGDKPKQSDQWGLKSKYKYMEAKAIKIRRAEEGSERHNIFPFTKKPKDSTKPSPDFKDKPYKEKSHHRKDEERKYEHPKKQKDEGKPHRRGREEPKKHLKHEGKEKYKGWGEEKESKGYKQDKGYKKHQDTRHHG